MNLPSLGSRNRLLAVLSPADRALLQPSLETVGLKTGQFFMTIRVACTGKTATPPLFETMEVLGRDRCVRRLHDAVARLDRMLA